MTHEKDKGRWFEEAEQAANNAGYVVEDWDGISDYQGWGVLLLKKQHHYECWAVLPWSYGSCRGCDPYEDESREYTLDALTDLIEGPMTEAKARLKFSDKKGW